MKTQNDKSYILNDIEVKLTGRTADKNLRSGKIQTVYEITPVHLEDGCWKKWVKIDDLYIVND